MNNTLLQWGDMSNAKANDGDTLLPSGVSDIPNSWFQRSASSFSSACEGDNIQDIFKVLSDVELPTQGNSSMDTIIKFLSEPQEDIKCQRHEMARVAAETKGKQEARRKRTRSAEEHNKSERMRRDRIKVKLRALQELIPNCNKSDRASVLDDAIEYLKALKLQVHMMSMGGSYVSPTTSIQTVQVPAFSPLLQINPGLDFNMGMPVMSCPGGPSASRFQVPFFPSPQLPVTPTMPVMQPRMATHLVQVPVVPQTSGPTMHSSQASHRTTTSSFRRLRRGESH